MVSLVIQSRILLDSLDSINQQFEFEFEIFDLSKIEINIFTNYGNKAIMNKAKVITLKGKRRGRSCITSTDDDEEDDIS